MKEYILPEDMTSKDRRNAAASITMLPYNSGLPSIKSKVTLQQNLFSFVLAGEKTVHYAGRSTTIRPDQFILLSAGNCLMSEKTADEKSGYRSVLLFFDNAVLADFFVRHPELISAKPLPGREIPYVLFDKDAFLENFVQSLLLITDTQEEISTGIKRVKLEELLLYLSETYPGKVQQLSNMGREQDKDLLIRLAVNASIDQQVTVEELAFLCNSSVSTFKRRFAKLYGTSPNRWLLEKRMEKAARLLKQGDHTASEIYFELGYENLSSFIQSFKQVHGITPKQYQLLR